MRFPMFIPVHVDEQLGSCFQSHGGEGGCGDRYVALEKADDATLRKHIKHLRASAASVYAEARVIERLLTRREAPVQRVYAPAQDTITDREPLRVVAEYD